MPDPIRLVIWDFAAELWDQVPRGGAPLATPLSLLRPLAHRGIVSAVCNRDADAVRARLELADAASLVLFGSDPERIDEDATQDQRIDALLRALRLPAQDALLISGSAVALREALETRPGLQFADDEVVGQLLDDPRLLGRDDPELRQLALFRLLLRRHAEERQHPSFADGPDAPAFLRTCDIHVRFVYGLAGQIDQAMDLIRGAPSFGLPSQQLPQQPEAARAALAELVSQPTSIGALVRLRDRFGDWGIVGMYLISQRALRQFAFSPWVSGLGVEDWVYDTIGRPPVRTSKKAAPHTWRKREEIDWITADDSLNAGAQARAAPWVPAVRARGGWAAEAVAHYLRPIAGEALLEPNVVAKTGLQVRTDHSALLRLALEPPGADVPAAVAPLGFQPETLSTGLFAAMPAGGAIVLGVAGDADVPVYQHTASGFVLPIMLPQVPARDLTVLDPDQVPERRRERVRPALDHLREQFTCRGPLSAEETEANLGYAFERVPAGATLFVLLAGGRRPGSDATTALRRSQQRLNESIRRAAASHQAVVVIDPATVVQTEAPSGTASADAAWRAAAALIARQLGQERPARSAPPEPGPPEPAGAPPPAPRRVSFLARLFGRKARRG